MVIRQACAALVVLALCACREPAVGDAGLIAGNGSVAVLGSSFVASGDSRAALGGAPVTYIISKLELTNDTSAALYPVVAHFYLTDQAGNRFFGVDSGASALTGISNDVRPLKPGEKRAFEVGFRADSSTTGTVRYEY